MKYRGVLVAVPGYLFAGISKWVVSSWFDSRQEAEDWVYAMLDGRDDKVESTRIEERDQ